MEAARRGQLRGRPGQAAAEKAKSSDQTHSRLATVEGDIMKVGASFCRQN